MADLHTDYLIAGAGAVGLAFADTLLAETGAELVIVDRHGLPGGHWNDAYPFVALSEDELALLRSITQVLQMVRVPQPAFSAALVAWLEAHGGDDAARNALSTPVPLPDGVHEVPRATLVNAINQARWNRDAALRGWIRASRLDGFGKLIDAVDPCDAASMAVLARLRAAARGVPAAAAKWMA